MAERKEKNQDDLTRAEVHYRLTHEEFLTWIEKHDLKWSEVKLYLYFCTLNPFGDREIEFSPDELYQKLKIKKSAFYSASARLEKLGLLSLKLLRAKARVFPINRTTFHLNGKSSNEMENLPVERKEFHLNGKPSNEMENEEPELPHSKASTSPHTIQTYTDYTNSLSDSEKEKFLEFGLKKASLLPNPPQLPQRWIEANWQELHEQFKNTPEATVATVEDQNWTQHPDWESWLELMRSGVPRFVALGTCFDRKMRRAIADWADERGLIWGVET